MNGMEEVGNGGQMLAGDVRAALHFAPEISFSAICLLHYRWRMTRQQALDLYFMEARAKLIDVAAFLDRVERSEGEADFRLTAFTNALKALGAGNTQRAKNVLLSLSDPTTEPIPAATTKAACGAWPE